MPNSRGRNITIMAIDEGGIVHKSVSLESINLERFLDFLDTLLHKLEEPSVIVMDNVQFHTNGKVKDAVESFGHSLLLIPPYSPFLNPNEEIFHLI